MEAGAGAERRVVAVSNAAFEDDPPPYSPPDPKSAQLLFPVPFHPQPHPHPPPFVPQPLPYTAVRSQARSPRPPGAHTAADPGPVLAVRGAARHGASNRRPTAAQGLRGGVGAGDGVLLPADRARRPPLFTRGKDGPRSAPAPRCDPADPSPPPHARPALRSAVGTWPRPRRRPRRRSLWCCSASSWGCSSPSVGSSTSWWLCIGDGAAGTRSAQPSAIGEEQPPGDASTEPSSRVQQRSLHRRAQ